jgi:NADPH-dependent glutamate synthase beta subunit-like oxidoreductase
MGGVKMSGLRKRASLGYYDLDQIIVDAQRCLKCQQKQVCVNHCALGLEIPKAMAAIAHGAFIVREGAREELEEAAAEAYAREAVNESFSHWQ